MYKISGIRDGEVCRIGEERIYLRLIPGVRWENK